MAPDADANDRVGEISIVDEGVDDVVRVYEVWVVSLGWWDCGSRGAVLEM